jgi:hypothetical protein
MMSLLNYAPFWRGELERRGGGFLHSEPRRPVEEANSGVTRFVQRLKHSMIGDHGAVSVRDIGNDEQEHW